jgi:hypothetical protein
MKDSVRLETLGKQPSELEVLQAIHTDPERGALLKEFIRSMGPERRDPDTGDIIYPGADAVEEMIQARLALDGAGRAGLSVPKQVLLQKLMGEFLRREAAAERFLKNLDVTDTDKLAQYVTRHVTTVSAEEFPLWIKGIAMRGNVDMDHLAQAARRWKGALRDTVTEKRATIIKEDLDRLRERYGVTQEEIDRLMALRDDNERLNELSAAVEKVPWFKQLVHFARQSHLGSRAGALNELIKELHRKNTDLEGGVRDIVAVLCTVNTEGDEFFNEIPDIIEKKKALEKPETAPFATAEAKEHLSPDSIRERFEAFVAEKGGPDAIKALREAQKNYVGDPVRFENATIPWGSGGRGHIGDIYDGAFTSYDRDNFERRGLVSSFLKFIFELFSDNAWTEAKHGLTR